MWCWQGAGKKDVAAAAQAGADTAAHVQRGQLQYIEQLRGRQHQKAQVAGPSDRHVEPNIQDAAYKGGGSNDPYDLQARVPVKPSAFQKALGSGYTGKQADQQVQADQQTDQQV